MRKLRVGVWIRNGYTPQVGGGFGYFSVMLRELTEKNFENAEIVLLSREQTGKMINVAGKQINYLYNKPYKYTLTDRFLLQIAKRIKFLNIFRRKVREKEITSLNAIYDEIYEYCDVIYYLTPDCEYPLFPYVLTIWDLGHFTSYAFPEFGALERQFEFRKEYFDDIAGKAIMIISESETGKKEIARYLRVEEQRIRIIPMFSSNIIQDNVDVLRPDGIPAGTRFIHYPAQYWAHKNHFGLLQAFLRVISKYPDLKLVLCGSYKRNWDYVNSLIKQMKLEDCVITLGFVSDEQLKWIYRHSLALVYPSTCGPTNMPPHEALALGCPAVVSDLLGHKEQFGDNVLYFNPLDIDEMADKILLAIEKEKPTLPVLKVSENYNQLLDRIFHDIRMIRFMWGK